MALALLVPTADETPRASKLAVYSKLFEILQDSAFLVDHGNFTILDANPAAEQRLGMSIQQLSGTRFHDLVAEESSEEVLRFLRIAKRRYYPVTSRWNIRTQSGQTFPSQVTLCTLELSDKRQVLQILVKDISPEFEAEQKAAQYVKDLTELNKKLEEQSITDEMTRLANYRYFKTRLLEEVARATRYNSPFSVIFGDLDHFKHYNDRNGHLAGDFLLQELGGILKRSCRESDLPARYGGEEFVILCPETSLKDANVVAERVRAMISLADLPHGKNQPLGKISISIGVAEFPSNGKTGLEVLDAADQAAYQSKRNGRDQITLATPIKPSSDTD